MKILRNLLTAIFGIATAATFFAPTKWTNDVWFNVARVVVMLIFLGLLLSYRTDHKLSESVKKAPKSARILMIVVPLVVAIFVAIQAFWPEFACTLVRKESWPFYRNAIFVKMAFQLVAAAFFVILACKFFKAKQILPAILACLFVLVLIMMAGEEISWGQRIFHWSTPADYASMNSQRETNLHNLATQLFQNALYFGGWLLLVALPFWRNCIKKFLGKFKKIAFLGEWLPPTYFLIIFAAAFGLCDPIITTDTGLRFGSILFSVLATAAILIYAIVPARGVLAERICLTLGVFMIALFFNLFVSEVWSHNSGVPTEYLEMFINFGIMLWAIDLKKRLFPARVRVRQRHH
jgi:hypothetical protein